MSKPEFPVINGGRKEDLPKSSNYTKETLPNAEINEIRVFTSAEIFEIIQSIAQAEGFSTEQLEISKEFCDQQNQLMILLVTLKKQNISYLYNLNHSSPNSEQKAKIDRTVIVKKFEKENGKGKSELVGRYENEKWTLTPRTTPQIDLDDLLKEESTNLVKVDFTKKKRI